MDSSRLYELHKVKLGAWDPDTWKFGGDPDLTKNNFDAEINAA